MKTILISFILVVFIIVSGSSQKIGESFNDFRKEKDIIIWQIYTSSDKVIKETNCKYRISYYDKSLKVECVAVFSTSSSKDIQGVCKFIFIDITDNIKLGSDDNLVSILNKSELYTKLSENEWNFKNGGCKVIKETFDNQILLTFILTN